MLAPTPTTDWTTSLMKISRKLSSRRKVGMAGLRIDMINGRSARMNSTGIRSERPLKADIGQASNTKSAREPAPCVRFMSQPVIKNRGSMPCGCLTNAGTTPVSLKYSRVDVTAKAVPYTP